MADDGTMPASRAITGGDAFARAHARMLADPALQHSLPRAVPPAVPGWLKALARAIADAWPVIRILVWIALGLAVALLLWAIARRFLDLRLPWRRAAPASEAEAEWRPQAAPARALLAEADALAARGRYGEAARLLLHRSVEDIARRRPALVRPATTSRDLAATPEVPAAARPAFALIAGVVEASLFADRGATAESWDRARSAYAEFALPAHWSTAE
ncbi:MAG TPA: hypothetical protein VGC28_09035 [Sphingomonas sp.]